MILAKPAILDAFDRGQIMIEPLTRENVRNSSVDVTLGEWYWLETEPEPTGETVVVPTERDTFVADYGVILNPYDQQSVQRMWGDSPLLALATTRALPGIPVGSKVIALHPGQNALCHTHEFIGGTDLRITTMMKARSSIGRNQVSVCLCAGAGDVGYSGRWTLEVKNHGNRTVVLVCGRRIAQVLFFETSGLDSADDQYGTTGKYQLGSLRGKSYDELDGAWDPNSMLPKMFLDKEAVE